MRLLCILDPTRPGSRSTEVAATLARAADAGVELVSVATPGLPPAVVDSFLQRELERVRDVPASHTRLNGESVVDMLLSHIAASAPDLVVLDSHGRGPIGDALLGGVSADLVRSSHAPTVLVGPHCGEFTAVDRLITAVDGSAEALTGLDVAVSLSDLLHAEVSLVEVVDEARMPSLDGLDVLETSEVHRIAQSVQPAVSRWDVLHGADVAEALVEHARGSSAMIVMGSHGRSAGRPRVVGGVTAHTVRHATVPVLVVSPESSDHIGHRTSEPTAR